MPRYFMALILLLEGAMIGAFVSLDLVLFFTFFEMTLIPMWLMIAFWGGPKRAYAANKFLIYTFAGSIFLLVGMIVIAFRAPADDGEPDLRCHRSTALCGVRSDLGWLAAARERHLLAFAAAFL